jgi:hypothetical protein
MQEARSAERLAQRITVDEFTEVTFNAVFRALQERKVPLGPIIYGIIYMPEGLQGGIGASGISTTRS